MSAKQQRTGPTIMGPVGITAVFRLTKGKTVRRELPYVRIDLDNLLKPLLDACTKAQVWGDDSQVCAINAVKLYGRPGITLFVTPLEDDPEVLEIGTAEFLQRKYSKDLRDRIKAKLKLTPKTNHETTKSIE